MRGTSALCVTCLPEASHCGGTSGSFGAYPAFASLLHLHWPLFQPVLSLTFRPCQTWPGIPTWSASSIMAPASAWKRVVGRRPQSLIICCVPQESHGRCSRHSPSHGHCPPPGPGREQPLQSPQPPASPQHSRVRHQQRHQLRHQHCAELRQHAGAAAAAGCGAGQRAHARAPRGVPGLTSQQRCRSWRWQRKRRRQPWGHCGRCALSHPSLIIPELLLGWCKAHVARKTCRQPRSTCV